MISFCKNFTNVFVEVQLYLFFVNKKNILIFMPIIL